MISSYEPGGESGIRTHEALLALTRSPGVRLRPLGHLSNFRCCFTSWGHPDDVPVAASNRPFGS